MNECWRSHPSLAVTLLASVCAVPGCGVPSKNPSQQTTVYVPASEPSVRPSQQRPACHGPRIATYEGEYREDIPVTLDHLKVSYMGRGAMTPSEIEEHVRRFGPLKLRLAGPAVFVNGAGCCMNQVLADGAVEAVFDAECPAPQGKKRFTLHRRDDGRVLLVMDSSPGEPHDPQAVGWNVIRYEEHVLVPVDALGAKQRSAPAHVPDPSLRR